MTNGGNKLLPLYWMKIWHVKSSVKVYSLSANHVWKLSSFFNCEKQSWLTAELKNLTTNQRKTSQVCGFHAAFLPNVLRAFEKLWALFNAEKKLFNPARVALTKTPRNEAKFYRKPDFLSTEERLLTSPGCFLTLSSSMDVEQVSFAFRSVYHV